MGGVFSGACYHFRINVDAYQPAAINKSVDAQGTGTASAPDFNTGAPGSTLQAGEDSGRFECSLEIYPERVTNQQFLCAS